LYADNGGKKPTAEMVEKLRQKINVNLRGRGAGRAFQISFVWHDPKTVAGVTNAIASQFIEQNLKVREDMAIGTTAFLENETEKMRREIETREKNLEIFKRKYMGMLPEQLQSNLNILGQLKLELNNLEERMQAEKKQSIMLKRQMKLVQAAQTQQSDLIEIAPDKPGETPSDELTYLIATVRQLRLRYTEKHPDVVALKRKIALIQQTHAAGKDENGSLMPELLDNPLAFQKDQVKFQLNEAGRNIELFQKKIRKIKKQIQVYNNRIERIPEVKLKLTKLTRDYSTIRNRYQSLLQKKIDARMAEQLERRQKGEQFKVLDAAIIPDKPFKPDIRKVLFMALIAGFGLGGGLAFLREIMSGVFYSPEELEGFLGTKVLVGIPFEKRNM
ncbi:MAG: hypothetical protein JRD93_16380, partial [Deltaproteobacteria bacterium]|nr:hypothetical protein [Deltaproteobacteria bacterium]